MSPTAGQLVTERFEYDRGRQVTAYLPPAALEAIVFAMSTHRARARPPSP
jgi:hypothetical protein